MSKKIRSEEIYISRFILWLLILVNFCKLKGNHNIAPEVPDSLLLCLIEVFDLGYRSGALDTCVS